MGGITIISISVAISLRIIFFAVILKIILTYFPFFLNYYYFISIGDDKKSNAFFNVFRGISLKTLTSPIRFKMTKRVLPAINFLSWLIAW
jgi:hypothetical protein